MTIAAIIALGIPLLWMALSAIFDATGEFQAFIGEVWLMTALWFAALLYLPVLLIVAMVSRPR